MEEVIKYFESIEARLAAAEERIAALEAQVEDLQNRPLPEPQVVEKVVEVEKPVEVIKEVIVEKPAEPELPVEPESPEEPESPVEPEPVSKEPVVEPEPESIPEPEPEPEPKPEPVVEEVASPKAAIYGKAVDDIRLAISLGDRFLYQRELFGQNAELMQRTLTELNELGSYDEALAYITSRFNWDTESSTYQQFLVTLHRRFG
jgi:hypothetical protein